jgi:hypothetical protein
MCERVIRRAHRPLSRPRIERKGAPSSDQSRRTLYRHRLIFDRPHTSTLFSLGAPRSSSSISPLSVRGRVSSLHSCTIVRSYLRVNAPPKAQTRAQAITLNDRPGAFKSTKAEFAVEVGQCGQAQAKLCFDVFGWGCGATWPGLARGSHHHIGDGDGCLSFTADRRSGRPRAAALRTGRFTAGFGANTIDMDNSQVAPGAATGCVGPPVRWFLPAFSPGSDWND